MASVPAVPQGRQLIPGGPGRRRGALLSLALCLLPAGCVPLDECLRPAERPPNGPVAEATAVWKPEVVFTQDPVHDGATVPGLAGRLYLFGAHGGLPVAADGAVQVHLYNDDVCGPDGKAVELERWQLDNKNLAKLLRKDTIGWGYTLFLPWGTFQPGIVHVHLMVCYRPRVGTPLYNPSGALVLHNSTIHYSAAQLPGGGSAQGSKPTPTAAAPAGPNAMPVNSGGLVH